MLKNLSIVVFNSFPGANYNSQGPLESFFNAALKQTSDEKFAGQVNVVILGSNDHRIISSMHPSSTSSALAQFEYQIEHFVENMLTIKQSVLVLVTTVLPRQFINPRVQSAVWHVLR